MHAIIRGAKFENPNMLNMFMAGLYILHVQPLCIFLEVPVKGIYTRGSNSKQRKDKAWTKLIFPFHTGKFMQWQLHRHRKVSTWKMPIYVSKHQNYFLDKKWLFHSFTSLSFETNVSTALQQPSSVTVQSIKGSNICTCTQKDNVKDRRTRSQNGQRNEKGKGVHKKSQHKEVLTSGQ